MNETDSGMELISIRQMADMHYNYHSGPYYGKYLREIKDNKRIYGIKCSKCGKVYIPPRVVCRDCFCTMDEWVPLSGEGTIIAFTVVQIPYIDPDLGTHKELPYTAAYINLDGTKCNIMHKLDELDEKKIKPGMRVRPVFADKRTGDYNTDIMYFTII
ncbi:MAG: Zn-ribbon domain-containing OB-fold protein [Dehalococcoidia bacterium]|nr:Zn-ribbon domain-containing OB-fold protein [Dehalococcoidia bacterium]